MESVLSFPSLVKVIVLPVYSHVFDSLLCVLDEPLAVWILFAPARTIARVYGLPLLSSPLDIGSHQSTTHV